MRITDFVPPLAIRHRLRARDDRGILWELANVLAEENGLDAKPIDALLFARENLASTALGQGVAVPHADFDVPRTVGALGIAEDGVDFAAPDGIPVQVFVALLFPRHGDHVKPLAVAAREISNPAFRERVLRARNASEIYAALEAPSAAPKLIAG